MAVSFLEKKKTGKNFAINNIRQTDRLIDTLSNKSDLTQPRLKDSVNFVSNSGKITTT